jgi:hypothetical protein
MFSGSSTYKGTDPEQGVGGESVTSGMIEPLDSRDQTDAWLPIGSCRLLIFPVNALKPHRYSPVAPSHVRVGWYM